MEVVHPRVAGIDVHKKVIWVAVRLPGQASGERAVTVRRFQAFWRPLRQMAAWLAELGVTDAAMESTGVYWWPVYHALAQAGIGVWVCNAAHMRNVPGRKTDLADCQWIAELHEHGLLRPSFIPGAQVAALRQREELSRSVDEDPLGGGGWGVVAGVFDEFAVVDVCTGADGRLGGAAGPQRAGSPGQPGRGVVAHVPAGWLGDNNLDSCQRMVGRAWAKVHRLPSGSSAT